MKYEDGKIVSGCVTGIEDYGIFVGFDEYYTGLIHISEISNNYVRNINDYVKVGETIKAKVISADHEHFQLKLSIKDINYQTNNKKREKIVETGTGFAVLKENLDKWIDDKLNEQLNNFKKNVDKDVTK